MTMSFETISWPLDWVFFHYFSNQKHFLKFFWISLILTGSFISVESDSFAKCFSTFLILDEWGSAGCSYLNQTQYKVSLLSIFWIYFETNLFLNGLPLLIIWYKCLYFEILIVWLTAESIIQPEPFPRDFICLIWNEEHSQENDASQVALRD